MIAPVEAALLVVPDANGVLRCLRCYGRGSAMRHFLIITCLAALVWATAPVQAALAQEDLPTVESEAEPSPEPDEAEPEVAEPSKLSADPQEEKAEDGQSERPSDADANTKAFSDQCDPACNSTSGISDPLTILRIAVAPIVLWIVKNLVSYSFQRIHMARAIYVDVEYRMMFARYCVVAGKRWLSEFDEKGPRVPLLNISKEDHRLYAALQPDLRECTWGAEVAATRLAYRSFDEMESVASRIADTYKELLSVSRQAPKSGERKPDMKRYRDLIAADIGRIERTYMFWVRVGVRAWFRVRKRRLAWLFGAGKSLKRPSNDAMARGEERVRWVVRSLLYGKYVWHLMCVYVPLISLVVIGAIALFTTGTISPYGIWTLIAVVLGLGLVEGGLVRFLRANDERRIVTLVVEPYRRNLQTFAQTNEPLTKV